MHVRGGTLIGGVGYRWQRDASFGVVAADAMARLSWPAHVQVADLGYGAIYAAQDIADGHYQRMLLVAAAQRGRPRGELYRYHYTAPALSPEEVQECIREAGAGVVHIDHLLIVAAQFGALPPEVDVFELEPDDTRPGIDLSPRGSERLLDVIALVRSAT
jgi:hydrogenase maturation protease